MIRAPEAPAAADGVLASGRRLGASLLALLQTRLGILSLELREEKLRAVRLIVWLALALALAAAAILLTGAVLALFLWRNYGYAGVSGLALALFAGSGAFLWWIRRSILRGPKPFATTLDEINKDIERLRPPQ